MAWIQSALLALSPQLHMKLSNADGTSPEMQFVMFPDEKK